MERRVLTRQSEFVKLPPIQVNTKKENKKIDPYKKYQHIRAKNYSKLLKIMDDEFTLYIKYFTENKKVDPNLIMNDILFLMEQKIDIMNYEKTLLC